MGSPEQVSSSPQPPGTTPQPAPVSGLPCTSIRRDGCAEGSVWAQWAGRVLLRTHRGMTWHSGSSACPHPPLSVRQPLLGQLRRAQRSRGSGSAEPAACTSHHTDVTQHRCQGAGGGQGEGRRGPQQPSEGPRASSLASRCPRGQECRVGYIWPFVSLQTGGHWRGRRTTTDCGLRETENFRGEGRGGWLSPAVGITEGTGCMEHGVLYTNNASWSTASNTNDTLYGDYITQ